MAEDVLRGYAAVSSDWIARSHAISPERLYKPVADLLPVSPSRIVDIGAGTGRDAAWLAEKGHSVVAVEPVAELRRAGMELHKSPNIEWLDDRFPHLSRLQGGKGFDLVLSIAVWQHLDEDERSAAMRRLAALSAAGGMLILSLRHGPGAAGRPVHQVRPADTIEAALAVGFKLVRARATESIQAANRAAGVRWTWLAFGRP